MQDQKSRYWNLYAFMQEYIEFIGCKYIRYRNLWKIIKVHSFKTVELFLKIMVCWLLLRTYDNAKHCVEI